MGLEVLLFRCLGGCCIGIAGLVFGIPLIFLFLLILQVLLIVPYLFTILVFYPSQSLEFTTQNMEARSEILDKESKLKKFGRLISMVLRSIPMAFLMIGFPLIGILVIIPQYGYEDEDSEEESKRLRSVVSGTVGLQLVVVSVLQIAAIVRHFRAFELKPKELEDRNSNTNINNSNSNSVEIVPKKKEDSSSSSSSPPPIAIDFTSFSNWQVIAELAIETLQMILLPIKFNYTSNDALKPIFLEFDTWDQSYDISFYFSVSIVLLLVTSFTIQFVIDLVRYWRKSEYDSIKARENFFYSFAGNVIYGHNNLKRIPRMAAVISFAANAFLVTVSVNFINRLSCDYEYNEDVHRVEAYPVYLDSNDDPQQCWKGTHATKAVVSLIFFSYYLPLSVLVSPMLTEAEEKEDNSSSNKTNDKKKRKKKSKDIRFKTSFIMVINLLKSFIFIIPFFFQQTSISSTVTTLVTDVLSVLVIVSWIYWRSSSLSAFTFMTQPCSIPSINIWRTFTFFMAAVLSIMGIIQNRSSSKEDAAWIFLVVIVVPVLAVFLIWTLYSTHIARRLIKQQQQQHSHHPNNGTKAGGEEDASFELSLVKDI